MEATVVCIDNSEWTRSGDFAPTRFQAQADAVNLLAGAKTEANPENTVGVLTSAGKCPRVLVTPTPDLGRVLNAMTDVDIDGEANIATAMQIAQLALKHRQNKNQRQRIVIFIGSPVAETKEALVKIGKKLKKNNVALDVVSFGCEEENQEALEALHGAVNSNENSHLVVVPPGPVLTDVLIASPVFQGAGRATYGAPAGAAGGANDDFEFGVDPNLDPELALALRVSMEEERARQEAAAAAASAEAAAGGAGSAIAATETGGKDKADTAAPAEGMASAGPAAMELDEDALLQAALAMSMQKDAPAAEGNASAAAPAEAVADAEMGEGDDVELQMALQLSMQTEGAAAQGSTPGEADMAALVTDDNYMKSVLASLPGVDPNDPIVKEALEAAKKAEADKKESEPKKEDDK